MNILVIYKKTIYELFNESEDITTKKYIQDHKDEVIETHNAQIETREKTLDKLDELGIKHDYIYRGLLKDLNESELKRDYIFSIGGDGTFLETSHYVNSTPILGINANPKTSYGHYCLANPTNLDNIIENLEKQEIIAVKRLSIKINNNEIKEQALNDVLFAHESPAATTKYRIEGYDQLLKNSGLLISTPMGSSAWIYQEGGEIMQKTANKFQYLFRGCATKKPLFSESLKITSLTRSGKIYIDGPHLTYDCGLDSKLEFNIGKTLNIVGNLEKKRKNNYLQPLQV